MIDAQGEFTAKLTPEGEEWVTSIFNAPRKVVMTLDETTMGKLREVKSGGILEINSNIEDIPPMKYKILRRDYKRCKVWLRELV